MPSSLMVYCVVGIALTWGVGAAGRFSYLTGDAVGRVGEETTTIGRRGRRRVAREREHDQK